MRVCHFLCLFVLYLAFSTPAWSGINDGLILHYDFEDFNGATIQDRSGNLNDGLVYNVSPVSGTPSGNGYAFDGLTSYIEVPGNASLGVTDVSVTAWIRPTNLNVGMINNNTVFGTFDFAASGGGFGMGVGREYDISVGIRTVTGSTLSFTAPNVFSMNDVGNWHFVAFTHSFLGGVHTVRIYLNGEEVAALALSGPAPAYGGQPGFVGTNYEGRARGFSFHREFAGDIADLRVYARTLSEAEVAELYSPVEVGGDENCALFLDGVAAYMQVEHSASLAITNNQMAISLWTKRSSAAAMSNRTAALVEKSDNQPNFKGGYNLRFDDRRSSGFTNAIIFAAGLAEIVVQNAMVDDEWLHIVATMDETVQRIYIDGVDRTTRVNGSFSGPIQANTFPVTVGLFGPFPSVGKTPFSGLIDNLAIWGRSLSEAEVSGTDWANLSGQEEGIVAYWTFDGCGTEDQSPNANHGELRSNAELVSAPTPVLSVDLAIEVYFEAAFPTSRFHLQYAEPPDYDEWFDAGSPVGGGKGEFQFFDSIRGRPSRIYRVISR